MDQSMDRTTATRPVAYDGSKPPQAIEEDIAVRPTVTVLCEPADVVTDELARSVTDARRLLKAFDDAAVRFGIRNAQDLQRLATADIAPMFARRARLKDLSLVPVKFDSDRSESLIERLLFESGRPVLYHVRGLPRRVNSRVKWPT